MDAGLAMSRSAAQQPSEQIGMFRSPKGGTVLSVRLNSKCNHHTDNWERASCGHMFCKLCNGHVVPTTRVAQLGSSPIERILRSTFIRVM